MSAPGLAALALVLGVVALLARQRATVPWVIGLAGLGVAFVASWALPVGLRVGIGGETFATTGYLRLFLALLAVTGGVLTLVAWAAALTRALPGLVLVWFAAAAAGLSILDPLPAMVLLTIGSLVPVLAGVPPGAAHDTMILGRGVRAVVVAGLLAALALALASLAAAWLAAAPSNPLAGGAGGPAVGVLGLAFVAAATGLALRGGAVPLHGWLGRLSEQLAAPAIPIIFAWGPAAMTIVLLGWVADGLLPHDQPLATERLIVGLVAIASLLLGALAALLHDDLEHVVGYSLVSDAGILLLALVSLDPDGWAAARTWILVYVVARSAFAAWATAVALAYGTRRISGLSGWARRSPLLAGSLVVIAVTAVGVPGLPAFEARSRLVGLALQPPLDLIAGAGIIASAGYFARLLITGFRRPSAEVALAVDLQPAWPADLPRRLSREFIDEFPSAVRRNRRPAAALAVFGLAMIGLAVAGGAFRGPALAAQPIPPPAETPAAVSPGPPGTPRPSESPGVSPVPTLPAEPPVPSSSITLPSPSTAPAALP